MTGRSHPTPTATATPTPTAAPTCTQIASTKGSTTSPSWLVWAGSCRTTVSLWEPLTGSKAVRRCSRRLTAPTAYIAANFNNTRNLDTISNWLLTPVLNLRNGNVLTFYTRTVHTPMFPDRLQVRMSTNGASTNVGSTATSVGDFTTLLLNINPNYTTNGYPNVWTQFTVTLSGLPPAGATGRLAFRYFVENAGFSGANSDYIGIDRAVYNGPCGSPTRPPHQQLQLQLQLRQRPRRLRRRLLRRGLLQRQGLSQRRRLGRSNAD